MISPGKTPKQIKLDERNHVEKPLLDQLASLGWEIIDLMGMKQTPADTHRESLTEVVMLPVLRERLNVINPWLEDRTISLAESRGGVLVTTHPDDSMVRTCSPWPTPELLQKYYASSKFEGCTGKDSEAATSGLGHYTDLQSLNSEDAVTWSVFGSLAYAPASTRLSVFNRILE